MTHHNEIRTSMNEAEKNRAREIATEYSNVEIVFSLDGDMGGVIFGANMFPVAFIESLKNAGFVIDEIRSTDSMGSDESQYDVEISATPEPLHRLQMKSHNLNIMTF